MIEVSRSLYRASLIVVLAASVFTVWLQQEAEAGLRAASCAASTGRCPAYRLAAGQPRRSGKGRLRPR